MINVEAHAAHYCRMASIIIIIILIKKLVTHAEPGVLLLIGCPVLVILYYARNINLQGNAVMINYSYY